MGETQGSVAYVFQQLEALPPKHMIDHVQTEKTETDSGQTQSCRLNGFGDHPRGKGDASDGSGDFNIQCVELRRNDSRRSRVNDARVDTLAQGCLPGLGVDRAHASCDR
jgi:hypothetical protein